jgi:hypothetical protein
MPGEQKRIVGDNRQTEKCAVTGRKSAKATKRLWIEDSLVDRYRQFADDHIGDSPR